MTHFSNTSLYALTVKQPSATIDAIPGDFLGSGKQQILTANGSRLSLFEVSRRQKGFAELFSQDVFAIIRRIGKFRLAGGTKDFIAITTDSGLLVTYEYMPDEQEFRTIHSETYGKSGVRRVVPGEYLAIDPKGRAMMIASTEKNKLVYILTRRGQMNIGISSPLEAHKPQTLVYAMIGLDVGYDNPTFAVLELDYSACETDPTGDLYNDLQMDLVYYELDLGLNHVVRKWSEHVDRSSNILFRVPGGDGLPSGVLCCGEDNISYRRIFNSRSSVHRLAIPRREGATEDPYRKRIIVAGTLYTLKGGEFFHLLQTDDGDVFKVTFDAPNGIVERIKIRVFDTLPVATSICILKAGFIYIACESGDRILYELDSLGDSGDEPWFDSSQFPSDPAKPFAVPYFRPRPLTNLIPVEFVPSMNPILDMQVANPTMEDAPQIYTVNGTGSRSTFRTTRNALEVLDLIESSLPQNASKVWTTRLAVDDEFDTLIILCLHSRTLILKIGEDVDEATNTGFLTETNTLGIQQFGHDGIVQIHPRGMRGVLGMEFPNDESEAMHGGRFIDWAAPEHRTIVACTANNRQIAVALSSGEINYFECDPDGDFAMADDYIAIESTVTCLAIPEVPEGRIRANVLAVGCSDRSVRVYSTVPDATGVTLQSISVQSLTAPATDLTISYMVDKSSAGYGQYLHIGLQSGVYIRSTLAETTGEIGDTRRRFLGPEPVTFARIIAAGEPAVVAMTSRPWLCYTNPRSKTLQLTPINYIPFKSAWNFEGSQFKGIICVSGNELRIFSVNNVVDNFVYEVIPLKHTPRKLVANHDQGLFYVIQSDSNTMDLDTRKTLIKQAKTTQNGADIIKAPETEDGAEGHNASDESDEFPPVEFGWPKAPGKWASCIQVVDPVTDKAVVHTEHLHHNQSALSAALVAFESLGENTMFLAVGVAQDLQLNPIQFSTASVQLWQLSPNGRTMHLYSETPMTNLPRALLAFKGKLAVGAGRDLMLYDCGTKALLRKAFAPNCVPNHINGLKTQGGRLVVSDQSQSVTYVVHKEQAYPQRLIPFVDDTVARWTTCAEMVDYETVVGGDKFGNLWVVRCPSNVSESSDEPNDGQHLTQDKKYLAGTPNRLNLVAHYFANDIPMAIQKTNLISGGERIIFWAGLQGTLGVLIPFSSRRQHKMFQQLELLLQTADPPISGRSHLAFRSYYTPSKCVIDGDLCERFLVFGRDKRESIAGQLAGGWTSDMIDDAIWLQRALYSF
ncbi:CPSF A subunit region-domain-containing protein [Massariosphaeria phaeospora]|uniref:CPSF A subunit region-domain-containing protein n=1 Tax=Massariosphaeria phaeospora TaxID=100035 RepID=A0A7C8I9H0_9PLEO|nr:CPSF A subunit region-domain-containing protein [Massariosphaeria phaeospora]